MEKPNEAQSDSGREGSEVIDARDLPDNLQTLIKKAEDALDLNNYDYAINLLQAVLKVEPCYLAGRKRLREAAVRKKEKESKRFSLGKSGGSIGAIRIQPMIKKDPAGAIVALEKEVLASEPYNPQGNQMLFEACTRADMSMTAGFALETLVKGNPENTKYMHQLGDFYFGHKFWDKATEVFSQITRHDPQDLAANQKEKNSAARASMAKQNYGGDIRDNLRDAGQAAEIEKQSRAGMTADQMDEQIAIYQAKYTENQTDLQTVRALASLYEQKEDFDNALEYYNWALQLSEGDSALEKKIVEVREMQRNQKKREFVNWLAANEGHDDYEKVKADYAEFIKQHHSSQIDDYREQVERNPTDNQLRFKYGEALFDAGDLKEAIPQLQRAQQSPSMRVKAMLMLGKCYDGRNMNDLAIDQLQKAANELQIMDDTKKEVLYTLGLVHEKAGDKDNSLEAFKQIYAVDYGYRDVAERVESSYE